MQIQELTESNFHLLQDGPAMVVAKAPWCGPCKSQQPTIEAVAARMAGKVKVFTLDTDVQQTLASRQNIRGLPTYMFFSHGQRVATLVGAAVESDLLQHCTNIL